MFTNSGRKPKNTNLRICITAPLDLPVCYHLEQGLNFLERVILKPSIFIKSHHTKDMKYVVLSSLIILRCAVYDLLLRYYSDSIIGQVAAYPS